MTATVEVAGPFKVERKPSTIAIEVSIKPRNWMLVLVIVFVLVIVAVLAARRKTVQLKSKTQEGEIRDRLKAGR